MCLFFFLITFNYPLNAWDGQQTSAQAACLLFASNKSTHLSRKLINICYYGSFIQNVLTTLTLGFVLYLHPYFFSNLKGSAEFLSKLVYYWNNMSDLSQYLFSSPGSIIHLFQFKHSYMVLDWNFHFSLHHQHATCEETETCPLV